MVKQKFNLKKFGAVLLPVLSLAFISSVFAASPVVNVTIAVEKTGSEPFDATTWDGATQSTAGTDEDEDNNVVRIQDSISYRVEVSVNDSEVDDLTATVNLAEKQKWIEIPTGCKTDPIDIANEPASFISADGTQLFCNLGPATEGTTNLFFPTARVVGADPLTGAPTLNDDRVHANVTAQADPGVNPSNIASDGDTEVVVTGNFRVDLVKELKVTATDPDTGDWLYTAPVKDGPAPDNRDGSIIEYVVKAQYRNGSMMADAPDEAGGDFEVDYQIIDVYTDDNINNNSPLSTGGVLYDWDPNQAACELIGDHGPNAAISCSQLNAAIDDLGAGATAPDGLNDPNIQIDLTDIDVRDPDADANLFEFTINIWFDKINDIDSHQNGSIFTDTVTNRVGVLANPTDTTLSGFNPVSTEDASNNNLANYGGSGEPFPNEVSYPLVTASPGSYGQHIAFTSLFAHATAKYPDQDMAAGETRPFLFNVYDYRLIDGAESQSCSKIDTDVWEYAGIAPPKQTPTPSLYPWNQNQPYNPMVSTFGGAVGTTLRDGSDFVEFYFTNQPIIDPAVNPTPTQAEWLTALRTNVCEDDVNGDGEVNIVDEDGNESNPGNPIDWWQNSEDVPGGTAAVTHVRHDAVYDAAAMLVQDATHSRWAFATNHLITSKLLTSSPYGTDNRLPLFGSYRRDSGNGIFTGWTHAPASTEDPLADATFGIAAGMADRMTLVPASHSISKYTDPQGLKVVRGGDEVDFIIEPGVWGLWDSSINTAQVRDALPGGTDYIHGSEEFSIDGGTTWLDRNSYDASSPDVTITSGPHVGGDPNLVWDFGSVDSGEQLPLIRYTVKVDPTLVSGVFDNTARISSALETDNIQGYRLTILPNLGLDVSKELDQKVSELDTAFNYDLHYVNLGGENYTNGEFIDIFPFIGDSTGLTSGIASNREPATTYNGTYEISSITATNGETFYATDDDPTTLNNDPCHESNQAAAYVPVDGDLCYEFYVSEQISPAKSANTFAGGSAFGTGTATWTLCTALNPVTCGGIDPVDITALRFEAPILDTSGGQTVSIEVTPDENVGGIPDFDGFGNVTDSSTGDIYTNSFAGRIPDISLLIISNDVSNTVVAGSISGNAWDDLNSSATATNSETEPVLDGLTVNLLDAVGNPVLDSLGSPITTTTDASGYYIFDQIPSGQYQVEIIPPASAVQTFDLNGAGDNNSGIIDVFGPNNPDAGSGLVAADYTDVDDITEVNFSYNIQVDLAVNKLVDGSDADTVFTDSEILDVPTAGTPTTFQYQITVTNESAFKDGTGVVLTDNVTEGVIITSVASVSSGSVSTVLPVTGASPFGVTTIEWNLGTVAGGATETLVLNAELTDANMATFSANGLPTNRLNQNVAQITAMNETDWDSTPGSHTVVDPSTFVATGSEDDEDDAFVFVPPMLGDFVWDDVDADGIQDAGEPGINGVTVNLYIDDDGTPGPSAGDSLFATTNTINNGVTDGFYVFGNLSPSTDYWVEFDHSTAAGYTPTIQGTAVDPLDAADSDGDVVSGWTELHNLTSGEIRTSVDQGYISRLSAGDLIWFDENNNGVFDAATESGISGVDVELYIDDDGTPGYSAGDTLVDTQTTDADGLYQFTNLDQGDYVIRVPDIQGDTGVAYTSSTGQPTDTNPYEPAADPDDNINNDDNGSAGAGTDYVTGAFSLAYNDEPADDGDTNTYTNFSIDLGFYVPISIGNRLFLDNDTATGGDGIMNGTEQGIPGATIRLLDGAGNPVDDPNTPGFQAYEVTSDADGYYRFDGLSAGDYIIEVDGTSLPAGLLSSPGQTTGNSPDATDHGDDTAVAGSWRSHVVSVGDGLQPTDETDTGTGSGAEGPSGNNFSNLAIDFGFIETGDVSVEKNVDSPIYLLGDENTITYTVDIANNGPVDAAGITFTDTTPDVEHVVFTAWTCSVTTPGVGALTESCSNANGTGDISETVDLNADGIATFTITAVFNDTTEGDITNTANVALPGYIGQSATNLPDTDDAIVTPQLQTPSMIIDKQLYLGHDSGTACNTAVAVDELVVADSVQQSNDLTYCFTVTNNGNTHLSSLSLNDAALEITQSDMTALSGATPLEAGGVMTFFYETASDTSIDNSVDASAVPVLPDETPTGQPPVTASDSNVLYIYVFDPPFGLKTGDITDSEQAIVNWNMVWINDSAHMANDVVITDEVPEGMTYEGNLSCIAEGVSLIDSCVFEDPSTEYPRGRVVVQADIGPDPGGTDADDSVNEVVISFDVTIDDPTGESQEEYVNQAELAWDANGDGVIDFNELSDDPVEDGDSDPSILSVQALSETGSPVLYSIITSTVIIGLAVATFRLTSKES